MNYIIHGVLLIGITYLGAHRRLQQQSQRVIKSVPTLFKKQLIKKNDASDGRLLSELHNTGFISFSPTTDINRASSDNTKEKIVTETKDKKYYIIKFFLVVS